MDTVWMNGGVAALAALLLAGALLWRRRRSRSRQLGDITLALADCNALLHFAAELQQHRGLSSTWLSGNQSFAAKVRSKSQSIESWFPLLRDMVKREERQPVPCISSNELRLFLFHWRELGEGLAGLTVEQSFAQHCLLVQKVLSWLAALGDARIALGRRAQLPAALARNVFQRLPLLTEILGQARAIGSAVAVCGSCAPVARVRLLFLVARAEVLLGQVRRSLPAAPQQQAACVATEQLLGTIRLSLLGRGGEMVAADQYFATASSAIDAVYGWIFVLSEQIGAQLAAPKRGADVRVLAAQDPA